MKKIEEKSPFQQPEVETTLAIIFFLCIIESFIFLALVVDLEKITLNTQ